MDEDIELSDFNGPVPEPCTVMLEDHADSSLGCYGPYSPQDDDPSPQHTRIGECGLSVWQIHEQQKEIAHLLRSKDEALAQLQNELDDSKALTEQLQHDVRWAKVVSNVERQSQVKGLQEAVDQLKREKMDLAARGSKLEEELERTYVAIANLRGENTNLSNKRWDDLGQVANLSAEVHDAEMERDKLQNELTAKDGAISLLEGEVAALKGQMETLEAEHEKKTDLLSEQIVQQVAAKNVLQAELCDLRDECESAKSEQDALMLQKEKFSDIQAKHDQLIEENQGLKVERDDLRNQMVVSNGEIRGTRVQVLVKDCELENLRKRQMEAHSTEHKHQLLRDGLQSDIQSLKKTVDSLTLELDSYKGELKDNRKFLRALNKMLTTAGVHIEVEYEPSSIAGFKFKFVGVKCVYIPHLGELEESLAREESRLADLIEVCELNGIKVLSNDGKGPFQVAIENAGPRDDETISRLESLLETEVKTREEATSRDGLIISNLQVEVQQLKEKQQDSEMRFELSMQSELSSNKTRVKLLEAEVKSLEMVKSDIEKELTALKEELELINTHYLNRCSDIEDLTEVYRGALQDLDDLKGQNQLLKMEADANSARAKEADATIKSLEAEAVEAHKREADLSEVNATRLRAHNFFVTYIKTEIRKKKSQQSYTAILEQTVAKLRDEKAGLEKSLAEATQRSLEDRQTSEGDRAAKEAKQQQIVNLEASIQNQRLAIRELATQSAALRTDKQMLQEETKVLQDTIELLQQDFDIMDLGVGESQEGGEQSENQTHDRRGIGSADSAYDLVDDGYQFISLASDTDLDEVVESNNVDT